MCLYFPFALCLCGASSSHLYYDSSCLYYNYILSLRFPLCYLPAHGRLEQPSYGCGWFKGWEKQHKMNIYVLPSHFSSALLITGLGTRHRRPSYVASFPFHQESHTFIQQYPLLVAFCHIFSSPHLLIVS